MDNNINFGRGYKEILKKSKKFTRQDIFNFFEDNFYLSQYSGRRRIVSRRKKRNFYRKIFGSSELFTSFQIDLVYVMKEHRKLSYYYFFVIDLTSKYLLHTKLRHRSARNIIFGLSKILGQIKQYRKTMLTVNNKDDKIIFYSDKGKRITNQMSSSRLFNLSFTKVQNLMPRMLNFT